MPNQTELPDPILQVTQERNGVEYIGKFGADAEHIKIELKDNNNNVILACNLLDFFKNWEDFKANNAFMYHGEATNLENQVKLWYGDNGYRITTQPQDCVVHSNSDNFSFTVVTNDPGESVNPKTIKYQWQFSADNGKTWAATNLTGEKTATLGPIQATAGRINRLFRCQITFSNKVIDYSNPVKIILQSS